MGQVASKAPPTENTYEQTQVHILWGLSHPYTWSLGLRHVRKKNLNKVEIFYCTFTTMKLLNSVQLLCCYSAPILLILVSHYMEYTVCSFQTLANVFLSHLIINLLIGLWHLSIYFYFQLVFSHVHMWDIWCLFNILCVSSLFSPLFSLLLWKARDCYILVGVVLMNLFSLLWWVYSSFTVDSLQDFFIWNFICPPYFHNSPVAPHFECQKYSLFFCST